NNEFQNSLTKLIKAQNQIKQLTIDSNTNQFLSDSFKKAILSHSHSLINYSSSGVHDINNTLLPTLYNLKTLSLKALGTGINVKYLKNNSLPHIESMKLCNLNQSFISELSEFI